MEVNFYKEKTCCFTGHRYIPASRISKLSSALEEVLEILITQRHFAVFISGGAIGFDLLAAKAVLRLKEKYPHIRLVMALPCRNQSSKWNKIQQQQYNAVLKRADDVIYLSENYFSGCMHIRNRYMVNNSSLCLVYMTHTNGGTAYTVRYAKDNGIETINISHLAI